MQPRAFIDFGISDEVADALAAAGMWTAFPIQEAVIPPALEGRDIMAQSPTGSGKTLGFAIPAVEQIQPRWPKPSILVLVPTRELAAQVVEEFNLLSSEEKEFSVAPVYGGVDLKKQARIARTAQIIVATPGRLEDLASREMIDLSQIKILVLDEADRMLDMGFQPQVDRIVRRLPSERQTMFFSATLQGRVGRLADRYTNDPSRHELEHSPERKGDIEHVFVGVHRATKIDRLIDVLTEEERGLALVFVRTKRGCDDLVSELKREGVTAEAMHGDLNQRQRERTLAAFESGEINILVATDVAARGLDLDDITHVVNYDPPDERSTYVHRVGRTGRAGRRGTAITLVLDDDQRVVGRIAERLNLKPQYEGAGLKIYPPRSVYTTKRRGFGGRRR